MSNNELVEYTVINIKTGDKYIFNGKGNIDDYLYPDDTNNMIIKKIINYCCKVPVNVNEIYAYMGSGNNSLCFNLSR